MTSSASRRVIRLRSFLLGLIGLCVLPLAALSIWLAFDNVQQVRANQQVQANNLAHNFATSIDQYLQARIVALQFLAASPLFDDASRLSELYAVARHYRASLDTHVIVAEVGGSRRMLINTRVPFGEPLPDLPRPGGRSAAAEALATGRPAVGDLIKGPVAGEPLVAIALPVVREDRATYLLLATPEAAQFQRRIERVALPSGWILSLLDSRSEVIARLGAGPELQLDEDQGAAHFTARVELPQWTVDLHIPSSVYRAPAEAAGVKLALAILAMLTVSVAGGLLASRKITTAIAALAAPAAPGAPAPAFVEVERVRDRLTEVEAQRTRANAERLASAERFERLFLGAPEAMSISTLDTGRLLQVNEAFCRAFGLRRDEMLGRTSREIGLWTNLAARDDIVARIRRGERVQAFEGRARHVSGAEFDVVFSVDRLEFDGTDCLLMMFTDISALKKAEAMRDAAGRRLADLLDTMIEGFISLDRQWRYLAVNRKAGELLGREPARLIGRNMWTEFPEAAGQGFHRACERAMNEQVPMQVEEHYPPTEAWFENRIYPTPDGIAIFFSDVTERKRAERELEQHRLHLEQLVLTRTAELEQARDRAQSADRIKSAFLATMSHELRTPLNSIIGFTGVLQQGLAGPLTAEQRKQLGMVRASARHLLALINDVLDISKIEAGQLAVEREPFDLRASIEKAVASVRPQADAKGLALHLRIADGIGTMTGDARRVEQVLLNLLSNALKFTDRGAITVTAEPLPGPGGGDAAGRRPAVRIRVDDTGCGIRPEDMARLFRPFEQIDGGLTRQHDGTGLGLAISQRLAALMGGAIEAESRWQQGSRFALTLPLNPEEPA